MSLDLAHLPDEVIAFTRERHLATLTTLRADGSPHVVPVGFTYEPDTRMVRVITWATSMKTRHAHRGGRAAVSQVESAGSDSIPRRIFPSARSVRTNVW